MQSLTLNLIPNSCNFSYSLSIAKIDIIIIVVIEKFGFSNRIFSTRDKHNGFSRSWKTVIYLVIANT